MSSHRMCRKENSSQLDAFPYSFVSLPNHISVVPYVKGCVRLQLQIMSKLRFPQQDTLHTSMCEGPALRWSWGRFSSAAGWGWWVPESGTFRSAQSHSFSLASLEEGQAEVASAMQWGKLSVGPWRNQCWLREVQGQQGLLYLEPGHQLSRDQCCASPCLAGKRTLSPRLSSHHKSHVALSKSWEEKLFASLWDPFFW